MSRNKGINKLVVSDDTTPSLQELPVLASETLGVFVHSTNSTVPSKLFLSQGSATQASFSGIEFDTDSGLGIFTDVPFVSSHDASIKFKARGTDYWKIEGVDGSSGDLLPLLNNQLKIGRSGFNLAEILSRKITSDTTLALAAGGATKWNLDSDGHLIPSTANSQNFGATSTALSQIFGNQLNSGTGQALYLGSNGGAYQWRIANGTNAAFIPNSTYDIGASGSRVGKLWGTDIDITGTINSGGFSSSGDVITNSIRTIGTSDNLVIKTGTGFAERFRITSDGKVGIGTTSPYANLDVASSLQIGSSVTSSNNFHITAESSGALQFWSGNYGAGTERLRITSSGDVGIGTASPGTKLDVSGSIRSSNQLISTVATGTAPLSVSSTTLVSNLNADLLDGQTGSYYLNYNNLTNTPTIGNGALTLAVSGTGLSGSASFTANQTGATTFTVTSNATNANTASTIVARDASGNFSAGTITANLTGTATTATYLNTAFSSSTADNITTRVNSGFWETSTATIAEGWPETTNNWYHLLCSTHSTTSNYFSMQFAGSFYDSNSLFYRATTDDGNKSWNRIWHSGNDSLLGTASNVANTIVRRDASGNFSAGTITAGTILTGAGGIEINSIGTGDRNSYIDFHSQDSTDFDARIIREPGINGNLKIFQNGEGPIRFVGPDAGVTWSFDLWANELLIPTDSFGVPPLIRGVYEYARNGEIYITNTSQAKGLWITSAGNVVPQIDNSQSLGNSTYRWKDVYAGDGTINTSDVRSKHTIENSSLGLNFINALRPVSYKWKVGYNEVDVQKDENDEPLLDENRKIIKTITPKTGTRTHYGLIAQEVKEVLEQIGKNDEDFAGWILSDKDDLNSQQSLRYHEFISPIIKSIQELSEIANNSTKALQSALEEIEKLKERIEVLES